MRDMPPLQSTNRFRCLEIEECDDSLDSLDRPEDMSENEKPLDKAQKKVKVLQPTDDADELPEDLVKCLSSSQLSTHFREFGKVLGVVEAKSLEDVYKSYLENTSMLLPF
jgi:hypothetical protein